jgi:5-methylcytosine-specific restriction endonuclease McrA
MTYFSPEYRAYIGPPRSPAWEAKRRKKLEQQGYRCERCKRHKTQLRRGLEWLEVHHRTYVRLGRERLSDLQVLCNTCHERVTRRTRRRRKVRRLLGV